MEDEERKVDLSHRTIQDEQARLRKKRQKAENVFAVFKKPLHESLTSVLPVMLIVLVLCFTIAPVPNNAMVAFLLGGVMLIAGMGLFTLGSEMSMIPLGQAVGSEITRRKKVWIITVVGFLIGMIITVAEPDLQVLANQVPAIENNVIIWSVAVGVGVPGHRPAAYRAGYPAAVAADRVLRHRIRSGDVRVAGFLGGGL